MHYLELFLFAAGAVLLAAGYRKNRRNILLAGAIILFFSAAAGSLVEGFREGYSGSRDAHTSAIPAQHPNHSFDPGPLRGSA